MPNQCHTSTVLGLHLKQGPGTLERKMTEVWKVKMEVQGDICVFQCMNWGHQPDVLSLNEADEEHVFFVGGSCVGVISLRCRTGNVSFWYYTPNVFIAHCVSEHTHACKNTIYPVYFPDEQHDAIHKGFVWFLQHSSCHASFVES